MAEPYNSMPQKPWIPVESIPLGEAVLCVNCNFVTRARNHHCPVCESTALLNLGELLERTTAQLAQEGGERNGL
jgi:uncharacterized paraquat-inducible protein A